MSVSVETIETEEVFVTTKQLTHADKQLVKHWLVTLFKRRNITYTINVSRQQLMIIDPGKQDATELTKEFTLALRENKIGPTVAYAPGTIKLVSGTGLREVPCIDVLGIEKSLLSSIAAQPTLEATHAAKTVDLPRLIKLRWSQFSEPMQKHIESCLANHKPNGFGLFNQTATPPIPVKLNNNDMFGEHTLDLMDVLGTQTGKLYKDPTTNKSIRLNELMPDVRTDNTPVIGPVRNHAAPAA